VTCCIFSAEMHDSKKKLLHSMCMVPVSEVVIMSCVAAFN